MKFDLKDLRGLLSCIKNNNLEYLSIREDGFELMINKELVKTNYYLPNSINHSSLHESNKDDNKIKIKLLTNKLSSNNRRKDFNKTLDNYFTIVSPMVGTFYRSPAPNEPYFIQLYDQVEKHQTVCIIEAMKLMNEIEAEINGSVMEILVKDGDIVDCGQALMKIKSKEN